MLVGASIVPFHREPIKKWGQDQEKKKRLVINLDKEEDEDIDEENFNSSYIKEEDSESESEEEFDLQQHLEDLLPGELVDGLKPAKEANRTHLEDLKHKPKRVDRFRYIKDAFNFIQAARRRERERRKHYILMEWEDRIKEYDLKSKQEVLDQMEAQRKEVLLEVYRSDQRRIKNSKKVRHLVH
jgi:hypothetical protein